jgi:DNA-binding response OmpR family regulator
MKLGITVLALVVAVAPQARSTIGRALRAARPGEIEIVWAADPSEAVEAAARRRPDLLLLEVDQPPREGWGVFERLRTVNPGAPVVVLSHHPSIYDVAVANRNGAVLRKPVGEAELADTVNGLLERLAGRAGPNGSKDAGVHEVHQAAERFRAELLERYNTPYAFSPTYRHRGINE